MVVAAGADMTGGGKGGGAIGGGGHDARGGPNSGGAPNAGGGPNPGGGPNVGVMAGFTASFDGGPLAAIGGGGACRKGSGDRVPGSWLSIVASRSTVTTVRWRGLAGGGATGSGAAGAAIAGSFAAALSSSARGACRSDIPPPMGIPLIDTDAPLLR
jgi:hypothetical protein